MKIKLHLKLLAVLALLFTFQQVSAVTGTMPRISDETNTYWYFIKNLGGWTSDTKKDRFVTALRDMGEGQLGEGVDAWREDPSKFKIVKNISTELYGIISQNDLYLQMDGTFSSTPFLEWSIELTTFYDQWGISYRGYRIAHYASGTRDAMITLDNNLKITTTDIAEPTPPTGDTKFWSFISDIIDFDIKTSTGTTPNVDEFWYVFQNDDHTMAAGRQGMFLNATGDNELIKGATTPQYWKFVESSTEGKVYIVNKDGLYVSSDEIAGKVRTGMISKSVPDASCEWDVNSGMGFAKFGYIISQNLGKGYANGERVAHMLGTNYNLQVTSNYLQVDAGSIWRVEPEIVNINIESVPAEGGTFTGNGTYALYSNVRVIATPNKGYEFVNWTANDIEISTENDFVFTANNDKNINANFRLKTYTIETNSNSADFGTVSGAGEYKHFSTCKLTATPAVGYEFVNWTENDTIVSTELEYSFSPTANRTFVANFQLKTYTIEASVTPDESGTVSGAGEYKHFSTCKLTATPAVGYEFVNWTENDTIVSTELEYSFNPTANRTFVANFQLKTYTIEASVTPDESGTVSGAGEYKHFSTCKLTATPAVGYEFVNWTENDTIVSTELEYSFSPTANRTFVANFQLKTYTIEASVTPDESGTVSGAGEYKHFSTCKLTATPAVGYEFVNWTENDTIVSTELEYSFNPTANRTFVANFQLKTYTIEASVTPDESGTVSGAGEYKHFSTCKLTATPAVGYEFVNWTENDTIVSTELEYSFSPTANRTFVANFQLKTYTIEASVTPDESGTVSGAGEYKHFSTCKLTATPAVGYEFVNWTENDTIVSTELEYSFSPTANRTFVANFQLKTYTIEASVTPDESGTVSGAGEYKHFSTCKLTATPAVGYEFVNWTENDTIVSTELEYSFSPTANRTFVANFQLKTYTIEASVTPDESGTVSGAGEYKHFSTCTLTATPAVGYEFVNWTENDTIVSTELEYSFSPTANRTFVANFQLKTYTIEASVTPDESGTVSGAGEYKHFSTCTLTATPAVGYEFVNWTENDTIVSTELEYSFSPTANRTFVANFQLKTYTIETSVTPAESGTVSGAGEYKHFSTCKLTATPAVGYEFVNWTENDTIVSTELEYSFSPTANRTFVANFQLKTYTIEASVTPDESGTVSGAGEYKHFSTCKLTATPAVGYEFVNWTENDTIVSTELEYSFSPTTNRTFVANFQLKTYTITASTSPANGGTVSGAGEYKHFSTCKLTATPAVGYEFVNWTENDTIVSTELEYSFSPTANRTFVANFQLKTYTIEASVTPDESGTVSGAGEYKHFSTCKLTATPAVGYEFVNWTENDTIVSTELEYSFSPTANRTFIANFQLKTYTIEASVTPDESGTVSGAGEYKHFSTCKLTATPAVGYEFVNWTENDTIVSTELEYSFSPTANRTFIANFQLKTYTITASTSPADGGTVSGAGEYKHFATCKLIAKAADGFKFVNWTEDGVEVSTNAELSFTVSKDRVLVANFSSTSNIEVTSKENIHLFNKNKALFVENANEWNLQIFNLSGLLILSEKVNSNNSKFELSENGIYIIRLHKANEALTKKMIIR